MIERYYLAASIDDAIQLMNEFGESAKIISGGTDLVLELEKEAHQNCHTLIDISRIPGLDKIEIRSDGRISIGALVTHNQVIQSERIWKYATCLAEACLQVGSPQIRNRGTVVGNLITASPANDTITPLVALDAVLSVVSRAGKREIRLSDFYTGVRKTILRQNEIVTEIIIDQKEGQISSFKKLGLRKAQAISLVNAAICADIINSQTSDVKIAVGSVAPKVIRLDSLEKELIGKSLQDLNAFCITEKLIPEISPISDIRSSAGYRADMVLNVTQQCLRKIANSRGFSSDQTVKPVVLEKRIDSGKMYSIKETTLIDEHTKIEFEINGKVVIVDHVLDKSILAVIREDAELTGTKEGCGEGECGACTIFLDGKAVMSCLVPAPRAHLAKIITIEGVSENEQIHPVQKAFVEEGAVQCGYCTPGFVMSAVMLLDETGKPDRDQIVQAISGNLCRCTGYYKIIKAIEKASLIKARE